MDDPHILLVEDEDSHAVLFSRRLGGLSENVRRCRTLAEAVEEFREAPADVVLLDLSLPDSQPTETLKLFNEAAPLAAIVILSSLDDEEFAADCVAAGAQDFLFKSEISQEKLERSIRYAVGRKQSELALLQSNEQLKNFAHTVAHEVRSPAAAALMALSALRTSQGPQSQMFFDIAERSLKSLNDLVSEMLSFAEVQADLGPTSAVDLTEVVSDVSERLRHDIMAARGQLTVDALPVVDAHPAQLKVLFQNLISNALKYRSPDRPPLIEVFSETVPGSAGVRVGLRDNGIGIPAEHLERLFDVFYRVTRETDVAGTGIGLALCKSIVERYSGRISVASREGVGTTFYLTFGGDDDRPLAAGEVRPVSDDSAYRQVEHQTRA